jgi:GntR family transcriptional regulator, galactonate operon transcriptional repressor
VLKTVFAEIENSPTLHQAVMKSLALKVIENSRGTETVLFPSETELCEQLGVSRSILREAVKVLAAKRMLQVRPKSGTRSRPRSEWNLLDPDVLAWQCEAKVHAKFLEDLCEMRLGIEPMSSELAAARATPEEIDVLANHLKAMELVASDPKAFIEPDVQFHNTIYQACRNDLIQHLATTIRGAFRVSLSFTTSLPGALMTSLPAHRRVFEAIQRRNPRAARLASEELVQLASEEIRQVINQERGT